MNLKNFTMRTIMNYYERLKILRKSHNLKQEDIADILKIKQTQYSRYELGKNKMEIDRYITLAKYYNVSLDYICGIVKTPNKLLEEK